MSNTAIWDAVSTSDPKYLKDFTRAGGFTGKAINTTYLIRRATEMWGPLGDRWGVIIEDERILDGATLKSGQIEKVHVLRISLRYPTATGEGRVPAFGQTIFVGENKWGPYTDEEAPKKSLTDALSKALSWLGFSADVYLGSFDDNKYAASRYERRYAKSEAKRDADAKWQDTQRQAEEAFGGSPIPEVVNPSGNSADTTAALCKLSTMINNAYSIPAINKCKLAASGALRRGEIDKASFDVIMEATDKRRAQVQGDALAGSQGEKD